MTSYQLKARQIPLTDSWDVIVVGGGSAGCAAAAAAARQGAATLLVESSSALGGMSTNGLIPSWSPFSDQQKPIYGGIARKIFAAAKAGMAHVDQKTNDWVAIDPEHLKRVYDDLVWKAGAKVLLRTMLCAVEVETPGIVDALILSNKAGLTAHKAKTYIDCTGDADLAAWAGAEFVKGDTTGDLQPATLCFLLSNVDPYAYQHLGSILRTARHEPIINKIVASGKYPQVVDLHADNYLIGPGTVCCNAGHIWKIDGTDPHSVSEGLRQGRQMAAEFRDAFAEFFPQAFAGAFLAATAPELGIRETRRIIGDYVLTIDDFRARRSFDDEIGRNCHTVDVQNASASQKDIAEAQRDYDTLHMKPGESHGIPYRCLTPRKIDNVLVAGRCISTDRLVNGSTRMLPVCLTTGEAAGVAAALASRDRTDIRAIDTKILRQKLRENGGYLPEN